MTVGNTGLSGTTGQDGTYVIDNVPVGTHSLTASAEGYQSQTGQGISVVKDETVTVHFSLSAEEIVDPPPGDPPVASFTYTCKNTDTCAFTDTSTGTDLSWSWVFGTDQAAVTPLDSDLQHPTARFLKEGNHLVKLTVTDMAGLEHSASATLTCTTRGQLRCR